jgi:signal transduction histidine kinase/PAS domain-containing protein
MSRLESFPQVAPTAPPVTPSSLEARLSLAEFLLGCEDLAELLHRTLEWLHDNSGVTASACLAVDSRTNRLVSLASLGLPERERGFGLELEDRGHPLATVLFSRRPRTFDRQSRPAFLFTRFARFAAVPLYGLLRQEDVPVGLLLFTPVTAENMRDTRWLADLLGHRMVRLLSQREVGEAEREFRRERLLLDAAPDPVILTDTEGRLLVANTRAERLLAARDGESEGRRRAVALNNMFFSSALARTAFHEGAGSRRELLLVDPEEGSDLLFELINTFVSDPREGTAVVSVLRNVSDLRQATEQIEENYRRLRIAESEVRAERDRLDLILDSVADPVLVTNPAGAIVMMNPPAARLFTASERAPSEEQARVSANDAHFSSFVSNLFITEPGARRKGELGLVDPESGQPLPVEAVAGTVLSEHSEIVGVVTILHDRREELERARLYEQLKLASSQLEDRVREATVELVTQNEQLNRQRLALEEASALKSQFLANMSHEIRTPLNAITAYTSMLLEGVLGKLEPKHKQGLERVASNARHLISLINDILDISRIEAGKMPLHQSTFHPGELIREVLAEVEPLTARSGLEIKSRVGRLPRIRSDRPKVKQIVLNLVTNAIKFTPKGSVTVNASFAPRSGRLSIQVEDTGIGIAETDRDRIFEDFRQVDSSLARTHGGAGLGLTISRRLARMLGGEILVSSSPGQGSTFSLVLSLRPRRR